MNNMGPYKQFIRLELRPGEQLYPLPIDGAMPSLLIELIALNFISWLLYIRMRNLRKLVKRSIKKSSKSNNAV